MRAVFEKLDVRTLQQIARRYNKHVKIVNINAMNKKDLVNKLSKHLEATYDTSKKMYKIKVKSSTDFDFKAKARKKPIKKVVNKPKPAKSNISKLFPVKAKTIIKRKQNPIISNDDEPLINPFIDDDEPLIRIGDDDVPLINIRDYNSPLFDDDDELITFNPITGQPMQEYEPFTQQEIDELEALQPYYEPLPTTLQDYNEQLENRALDLNDLMRNLPDTEKIKMPIIETPIIPIDESIIYKNIIENWTNPDIGNILSDNDPRTFNAMARYIQDMNQDNTEIFDTDIIEFLELYISEVISRFGAAALFNGVNQIADYAGALTYNPSFFRGDVDFYLDNKIFTKREQRQILAMREEIIRLDTQPIYGNGIRGGEMPTTKANLWTMEDNAYSNNPVHLIDGWSLIQPFSTGIKAYRRGNDIMIAVRGTDSIKDVYADARIANGSLRNSQRYKEDRNYILNLQKEYNTQDFFYFGVGHSLGGAICDLLIDEGIIQEAVSYNPAIEDQFLHNTKNYRIYNEDDPLYKIMGKRASNVEVRKNNLSTFDKLANFTTAGKLKNALQAHSLDKFKGGESWRDLKRDAVGLSGGDWADSLANAFGIDRQGSFLGEMGNLFERVIPIAKAFI